MKKYIIWAVLMFLTTACQERNDVALPLVPIPGFELVKIRVAGRITQTISGLPVPKDAITIDLYEESNNFFYYPLKQMRMEIIPCYTKV